MPGSRLSRLIRIITLLRGPVSYNARRLAEELGVGERTVYRDLQVLELAAVPWYFDREFGERGGYRIRSDWYFPTVQLSHQECVDLAVLTRGVDGGQGVPLLEKAGQVRDKIMAGVPAQHRKTIQAATELFDIIGLHLPDHSRCRGIMLAFQQALLSGRQLDAVYQSPVSRRSRRFSLQPRRVFLAGHCWYAACFDNASRTTKLYRLARFTEAKVNAREVNLNEEFSLRDFLGNAWTVFRGQKDWSVEIRFDAEVAPLVGETCWHHTQELIPQKDGRLLFRATVSGLEEIRWWILTWGPKAKVLQPKELAAEVRKLAAEIVDRYK